MAKSIERKYAIGDLLGDYKIIEELGSGGNGIVYKVEKDGIAYAAKTIKNVSEYAFQRFKNEIEILKQEISCDGILPLLDSNITDVSSESWYIMPIAKCLKDSYTDYTFKQRIIFIYEVSKTLKYLHSKNIFHRDIKPDNLFIFNGRCVLSDFGLVDFPENECITREGVKLGPLATIAPEMRHVKDVNDSGKADVYSLAKTLWILISKNDYAFDGVYSRTDELINFEQFIDLEYPAWLHDLFEKSTVNNPDERIGINEFNKLMFDNYCSKRTFWNNCTQEWKNSELIIQNTIIPDCIEWTNINDIQKVLSIILSPKQGNHSFFSDGGGQTFRGDVEIIEKNKVSLKIDTGFDDDTISYWFTPKKLLFIPVHNNPYYDFYWLENETEQPLYKDYARGESEDLIEVDGEIIPEEVFWENESKYKGLEFSKICKRFKGALMITNKSSVWNQDFPSSYSGDKYQFGWKPIRDALLKLEKQHPISPTIEKSNEINEERI